MIAVIRKAREDEAELLSRLSLESKQYWNYPQAYFDIWNAELQISRDYIAENDVWVFVDRGEKLAFCSMVHLEHDMDAGPCVLKRGYWLDHLFVLPAYIGRSIGRQLFEHLATVCRTNRIEMFSILADPNSRGFYERMGCAYIREVASSIPGRTTPLLKFITDSSQAGKPRQLSSL